VILQTKVKSIYFEIERDLVWSFPFVDSNINVGEISEETSKFGRTNSQDRTALLNSRIYNPTSRLMIVRA